MTTIAHVSFNLYMFKTQVGNAVLTGLLLTFMLTEYTFLFGSGAIASTYTAGTAIGGLCSGWAADRFGRKKCIIASAAVGM